VPFEFTSAVAYIVMKFNVEIVSCSQYLRKASQSIFRHNILDSFDALNALISYLYRSQRGPDAENSPLGDTHWVRCGIWRVAPNEWAIAPFVELTFKQVNTGVLWGVGLLTWVHTHNWKGIFLSSERKPYRIKLIPLVLTKFERPPTSYSCSVAQITSVSPLFVSKR